MSTNFFGAKGALYYIYSPDFRETSAGIRALYQLCNALNECGEEAYIAFAQHPAEGLRTPLLTAELVKNHFLSGRTVIAVYPEVVSGNPLKAPIVARWMLNKPGHLGGDVEYAADELLFHFDEWILPEALKGKSHQLIMPALNPAIFNNTGNEEDSSRKGYCYYASKYLAFGGQVSAEHKKAKSLCHDVNLTRDELAQIFRKSEALYCYEQSSIIPEALACGCPVLLVPTSYWPQTAMAHLIDHPGIAIAGEPDALTKAKSTVGQYQQVFEGHLTCCQFSFERFAVVTRAAYRKQEKRREQGLEVRGGSTDVRRPLALPSMDACIWGIPAKQRSQQIEALDNYLASISKHLGLTEKPGATTEPVQDRTDVALASAELKLFEQRSTQWTNPPSFHIVVMQDNATDDLVVQSLNALSSQHYSQVIATVISHHPAPANFGEGRLEWWTSTDNHRLVANEVIANSPAQWCGVIRAGDQLAPHALLAIAEFVHSHPEYVALYTDEDVIDETGGFTRPLLKPDFDRERLYSCGYIGGFLAAKKEAWIAVGGLRPLTRGIDEFDAALRLACAANTGLGHLPGVLYHRHHTDPALLSPEISQDEEKKVVLQEILNAIGTRAEVTLGLAPGLLKSNYLLENTPGVTIIVPTRDKVERLDKLITSLLAQTAYPDYELLILDNDSTDERTRAYLIGLAEIDPTRIRVVPYLQPFNHAAMLNHGASLASKQLLLFLHDDISIVHQDWLTNMVTLLQRPNVQAVGARLLSADSTCIVEAGIVPSQAGILGRPFSGWPIDRPAPLGRLHAEQHVSAISAACMLVNKETFLSLGGMDAERFPEKFADIDFCLKLTQAGKKIMWTPYATLIHDTDNTTWGDKNDNNALLAKWGKATVKDPCHNPYIALGSDTLQLEAEPVFIPDPITWHPVPNLYSMSSDKDGAGHYRVIQPVHAATESGLIRGRYGMGYPVPMMVEKLDIDVVFSQRQLEDRQLDNLARFKQLLRCKIVMDFDDLLTNVPDKNIHKRTLLKDMKGRLRKVGTLVDRFTVSTEPLAQDFKQYHDDVRVVPNALLRSQWAHLTSQRATSKKLRVGWAGGVSHQGDLEVVRDVVKELAGEVEWVFMGMCLKELNPHIKEFHAGAPFNAYPEELAKLNLDLAIAPLELNPFNECKSHLRILEYGILGIPVIATNITPYQSGFPITLVKNKHQDWVKAFRDHINNVDETYKRGDALRQYILDNWMLDQHLETWRAAWDV